MLCCVGDLVEDIVVRVPTTVADGSDTDVEIDRRRGGSAANVAVAAADAGAAVCFVGRIGEDGPGDVLVGELVRHGVVPRVQRGGRTGSIVVLVDPTGERSMLRDRGAAGELADIDPQVLDGVTWLHVPAYSLVEEPSASAVTALIEAAHRREVHVSVDVSSVAVLEAVGVERFIASIRELCPDVLLCNETESAMLFGDGSREVDGSDVPVVEHGPEGAAFHVHGSTVAVEPSLDLGRVPDTTGAGDAFAAGFIVAAMAGASVSDRLSAGHAAAASHLRSIGATDTRT